MKREGNSTHLALLDHRHWTNRRGVDLWYLTSWLSFWAITGTTYPMFIPGAAITISHCWDHNPILEKSLDERCSLLLPFLVKAESAGSGLNPSVLLGSRQDFICFSGSCVCFGFWFGFRCGSGYWYIVGVRLWKSFYWSLCVCWCRFILSRTSCFAALQELEKDLDHPGTGFAGPFRFTLENSSLGLGSLGGGFSSTISYYKSRFKTYLYIHNYQSIVYYCRRIVC